MRRRRRRSRREPLEAFEGINITPFTDVLLVLLIIFMIAGSSLAPTGIGLSRLAVGEAVESNAPDRPTLVVAIGADGRDRLLYGDRRLLWSELEDLPRGAMVTLRIHPDVPAEEAVQIYERLLEAGLRDIEWAPPAP